MFSTFPHSSHILKSWLESEICIEQSRHFPKLSVIFRHFPHPFTELKQQTRGVANRDTITIMSATPTSMIDVFSCIQLKL